MPKKTRRRTSVPKKSPTSYNAKARAIAHKITEKIKQVSGVEFMSHQQEGIEELLSEEIKVAAMEGVWEGMSEMRELFRELKVSAIKILVHIRDIDKSRAAHARHGRSKSLRERTIAQGIVEKTEGWDGKHHFKKAQEIQGAINALLEKVGLKTARATPQTISIEALSRRLKRLSNKIGSARSD
jgi:hypothetical protein